MEMGPFAPKVDYRVGEIPLSVFIADLDGDADNDIVAATAGGANVSVLMNNGDGTFTDKVGYATGNAPWSVFSADLDGDGDNDLAVANFVANGTVSVLLNLSVTPPPGPPAVTSINPTSGLELIGTPVTIKGSVFQRGATVTFGNIAATDVVVVATNIIAAVIPAHPAGTLDVTVTNPDGLAGTLENGFTFVPALFGPKTDYATGDSPGSVFSADLDGDGDNDLAVANSSGFLGTVSVLLNNGDGTFAPQVDYDAGISATSVFSADLDGDGDNDLAVANTVFNGTVSVLLNNGDGTFAPKVDHGAGSRPRSVFSVDLDEDGDNDLVVANRNGMSVLLNKGDGTICT